MQTSFKCFLSYSRPLIVASLFIPFFATLNVHHCWGQQTSDEKAESLISTGLYTDRIFLQGLDKVTGRVFKIEAKIGEEIKFEKLRITVRQCRKAPPEEPAESLAFLDILEDRGEGRFAPVFNGWMFASNPAVSGLEHPVYDVWVHECTGYAQNTPPIETPSVLSFGEERKESPVHEKETSQQEALYFEEGNISEFEDDGPLSLPETLENSKTVEEDQMDAFYKALDRVPPVSSSTDNANSEK